MALWVDKYRPKKLDRLNFHTSLNNRLHDMINSGDIPHVLFYGPSGSGKKSRITALLREFYGPKVDKVKVERKEYTVNPDSLKKVEITVLSSIYHIELSPSEVGRYDRVIVQELIKEVAGTHQLDSKTQKNFKVVVLNEVDTLTRDAQQALRRTMEKFMKNCRLICSCRNISKVIEALRSRCLLIRVPAPQPSEIVSLLQEVAQIEKFQLSDEVANKIVEYSNRNIRKALLILEAAHVENNNILEFQNIKLSDWENFINEIARLMVEAQDTQRIMMIREKFYELIQTCIPPTIIFQTLVNCLLTKVDDDLKMNLVKWAAYYEHRMQLGSKPIMHLEAFVCKFMSIYKQWTLSLIF